MTSAIGSASGFTLIELLVVLAILTLVAAALPLSAGWILPARALDAAQLQLVADLKAARRKAVRSGDIVSLTIDPDQRSYRVGEHSRTLASPLTLTSERTGTADRENPATVAFYPDGSAQGVFLNLRHGTRDRRLSVAALTATLTRLPAPAQP